MWTRAFWKDTAERAVKTAAQSLAGALAGYAIGDDWKAAVIGAVVTTASSVLTSIASAPFGTPDSASLVSADVPPEVAKGIEYGYGQLGRDGYVGEHREDAAE